MEIFNRQTLKYSSLRIDEGSDIKRQNLKINYQD